MKLQLHMDSINWFQHALYHTLNRGASALFIRICMGQGWANNMAEN